MDRKYFLQHPPLKQGLPCLRMMFKFLQYSRMCEINIDTCSFSNSYIYRIDAMSAHAHFRGT